MNAAYHDIPAAVTVTNLTDHGFALVDRVIGAHETVTIDLHASRELNRARRWAAILRACDGGMLRLESVPTVALAEPTEPASVLEHPSMPPADSPDSQPCDPPTL